MYWILSILALAGAASDSTRAPEIDYRMELRLDEGQQVLDGRARMRYTHRAGEALDSLYFNLYLNAFRPNSAWARRELEYGERRFQDLGPNDYGYDRLKEVRIDGTRVTPTYPYAPDSTVFAVPLPRPLRDGQTADVRIEWQSRLATVPRRQGRRGRHFDFAHGFPRIAVFERGAWQVRPHLPQGEFYGEFASFDVTMDVPADQVIAATGVPVSGDPGWAAADRMHETPALQRDVYARKKTEMLGLLPAKPASGRKQVRWRAERVHNFAWNADPQFVHEGRDWNGVALHALMLPSDTGWADGRALDRVANALDFLKGVFAPYPYPQLTVSRRIESGATEFPMMEMNSSGSPGQVMHETAHQYAHGILANNEWREGWLDEGMAEFLTNWFWETRGVDTWQTTIDTIANREAAGATQPISLASAEFSDPRTYSFMTYSKPALVLRMLRDHVGEPTMRRILQQYYADNAFTHVTAQDFQAAAEKVSGEDLDWFFDEWIRSTRSLDYAIGEVGVARNADGGYRLRIEVTRAGDAWMPVVLQAGSVTKELDSRERQQFVVVDVAEKPERVVLDPMRILIDRDRSNNAAVVPDLPARQ